MTRDNLKDRLRDCFLALFPGLSSDDIASVSQQSIPEWDSLASITLLTLLRQEFHLEIDITNLDRLLSFADLMAYLEERIQVRD